MPAPTEAPQPAATVPELKPAPSTEVKQPAPVVIKPAPPAITPVPPAAPNAKPGVKTPSSQNNTISGKELGLKPIESPLLPITAAKEAQLQALLAKYKADQITPVEYHNQRAEILAQP